MQKRKNIRLLITLAVLIIFTAATFILLRQDDQAVVKDSDMFAVTDVSEIDSVILRGKQQTKILHFKNNSWLVNNRYDADPQKLTILFAILNQVRAKRPVAEAQIEQVDSLFQESGTMVTFYKGDDIVKQFEVAGIPESGLTYFRNKEGTFIVNIPGYRSYLAALFDMSLSDWRNKLIFDDVSWNNLEKVAVDFPVSDRQGFEIIPEQGYFTVEGIATTDSLKLLDYLDRVSLLTAREYIEDESAVNINSAKGDRPVIKISVTDIRNRPFMLDIFSSSPENKGHFALKDSTQWLILDKSQVVPLLHGREYFIVR